MATITAVAEGPGKGARRPLLGGGPRVVVRRWYSFDFDNSYPTGGEDISTIFNDFQAGGVLMVSVSPIANRVATIDYTNKKIQLYTALGTEAGSASDQSTITGVRLAVDGYPA